MGILSDLFTPKGVKIESDIGDLFIDATISESPVMVNRVTENPIEDGSLIADNVVSEPNQITLTGIITDDPVRFLSGIRDLAEKGQGSLTRSKNAFELLEKLKNKKTLVTITTEFKVYESMLITKFSPNKDSNTGLSLRFVLELRELIIKKSQTVTIPRDSVKDEPPGSGDQAASTVDAGKQPPKVPSAGDVQGASALKDLLSFFGRLIKGQ